MSKNLMNKGNSVFFDIEHRSVGTHFVDLNEVSLFRGSIEAKGPKKKSFLRVSVAASLFHPVQLWGRGGYHYTKWEFNSGIFTQSC